MLNSAVSIAPCEADALISLSEGTAMIEVSDRTWVDPSLKVEIK